MATAATAAAGDAASLAEALIEAQSSFCSSFPRYPSTYTALSCTWLQARCKVWL